MKKFSKSSFDKLVATDVLHVLPLQQSQVPDEISAEGSGMNHILTEMLARYQTESLADRKNAVKEVMQEIMLNGK